MSAILCEHPVGRGSAKRKHFGWSLLRRVILWPARVAAARRTMRQLAGMSDDELRDIGLGRYDIINAAAGRLDDDPTERLTGELSQRRKAPRGNLGSV